MPIFATVLYLLFYAIFHSILAMDRVKKTLYGLIPQKYYRLLYTLISIVLLAPLPWLSWPTGTLYHITPPLSYLFHIIQTLGILGFLWALRHTDVGNFLGVTHIKESPKLPQLITTGPYRLCRHPLYFWISLIFVTHPNMTYKHLILTLWLALYFWVGSYIEERRLTLQYGQTYTTYQTATPRLIPFI